MQFLECQENMQINVNVLHMGLWGKKVPLFDCRFPSSSFDSMANQFNAKLEVAEKVSQAKFGIEESDWEVVKCYIEYLDFYIISKFRTSLTQIYRCDSYYWKCIVYFQMLDVLQLFSPLVWKMLLTFFSPKMRGGAFETVIHSVFTSQQKSMHNDFSIMTMVRDMPNVLVTTTYPSAFLSLL